jgi:hypothetical protein
LGLFALDQLVVYGTHYGRVADRSVVQRHSVDYGDRVEESALLDFGDCFGVLGLDAFRLGVLVLDDSIIAVPAVELSAYDCRDLLRRP